MTQQIHAFYRTVLDVFQVTSSCSETTPLVAVVEVLHPPRHALLAALPLLVIPAPTRYPPADAGHLHRTHKSSEGDSDQKRDGRLQPSINQNQRGDNGGQRTADLITIYPVQKLVDNAGVAVFPEIRQLQAPWPCQGSPVFEAPFLWSQQVSVIRHLLMIALFAHA
jgi:hypothetical protein